MAKPKNADTELDQDPEQSDSDESGMVVVHREDYDGEHVTDGDEPCPCGPEYLTPEEAEVRAAEMEAEGEPEEKEPVAPTAPDTVPESAGQTPAVGRTDKQEASVAGMNQAHYQSIIDGIDQEYRNTVTSIEDGMESDRDRLVEEAERSTRKASEAIDRAKADRDNRLIAAGVMDEDGNAVYENTTIPEAYDPRHGEGTDSES